jgi:hypothetical protein
MKKFGLLILISLLPFIIINSQSLDDYRSKQSGNWNSTASWERYDGTNWIVAIASPTSANGVITIRSTNTITITETVTYDQVIVEQGGQVTVASSSISTTLNNGTGTDLVINGTWLNQGGTWTTTGTTWTVSSTGTFIHNTASGISTPLNSATFDAASTFIYLGSSSLRPAISVSGRTYGNLRFESTSGNWLSDAFVSGTNTLTILGNFYVGSGVNYNTAQTGLMSFAGDFIIDGTLTNNTGTQSYNFTGVNKFIGGSTSTLSFENVTINSGASYQLQRNISILSGFTLTVDGDLNCAEANIVGSGNFTLAPGGTLGIGSSDGITNSGSSGNVQVNGTRLFNDAANYIYNGTLAQNTGNALPASLSGEITIDNTTGVSLSQSLATNGSINLTNGALITGDNILTAGGSITRTNGIVNGNLNKSLADGGPYTFEVGTSVTKYLPVIINNVVGTGTFTVNAVSGPHPNVVGVNTLQIYWKLTNGGLNSADITFNYLDEDVLGDENNYVIGKYDGNWSFPGGNVNTTTNQATITGVTSFSDWSLGDQSALPVELSSFSASVVGNTVKLNWKTETEVNNYGFEIERYALSAERKAWEKIGFVNGSGNSNSPKRYSFLDDKVSAGKYSYRLKQIDNDGQFEYSKSIEVDFGAPKKFELSQNYPNPFNPVTTIRFNLPEAGNVKLTLFNILGQELKTLVNEFKESGVHTINFDASELNSGMYIYKIEAGTFVQTRKMTLVK